MSTMCFPVFGWLHEFPYVANHFGKVRAVVGLPIALSFGILGESEISAVLSTSLFFVATVSLTMVMLSRLIGPMAALLACVVMSSIPLLALKSTIASSDLQRFSLWRARFGRFGSHAKRNNGPPYS
jgi:hypothetical protein